MDFIGTIVGSSRIPVARILVVAHWLSGWAVSFHKAAPGISVFIATVIFVEGAVVVDDDRANRFAVLAFGSLVGTLELVVEAAFWATKLVTFVVAFGRAVCWVTRVSIDGIVIVAGGLAPGTVFWIVQTTIRLAELVTIVVESKGAIVNDPIVFIVVRGILLVIAKGLLDGAVAIFVEATERFPLFPAIVVKAIGAVVSSRLLVAPPFITSDNASTTSGCKQDGKKKDSTRLHHQGLWVLFILSLIRENDVV